MDPLQLNNQQLYDLLETIKQLLILQEETSKDFSTVIHILLNLAQQLTT